MTCDQLRPRIRTRQRAQELEGRESRRRLQVAQVPIVADVQLTRVAQRLKIPRGIASGAQRIVDEMPSPLARKNLGMQGRKVPSLPHLGEERPRVLRMPGVRGEVPHFVGIVREIVELVGIDRRVHEFVAAAFDHHQRCDRALGQVLPDDLVASSGSRELRDEAAAFQSRSLGDLDAGEFA